MIKIGKIRKIVSEKDDQKLLLISTLRIDDEDFDLIVSLHGKEYFKYIVDDRTDAFLFGVLPYAMRHGHDIICEQPVTGNFLFNLETQYIPALYEHDVELYRTKIKAETIEQPVGNCGACATGLSCGVDCLYTVSENYNNHYAKDLALTHFLVFNEGAFGGSYYGANRSFTVKNLYKRSERLANELGLPIIQLGTNLEALMRIPVDRFLVNAMGMIVLSISKLIGVYHYSSSGADYGDFSIKNSSKGDTSYYDLLSLSCISYGATHFYSAGGAQTRFRKLRALSKSPMARKYLHSCLYYDFNCGQCVKCYRNLITFDALGTLDEFREVYNIDEYKKNRTKALEYLVKEILFNGWNYKYLKDAYDIIKKREPETISALESKLTIQKLLERNTFLETQNENRLKILRAYKTLASASNIEKVKRHLREKNVKRVILYSYSICTDLLVTYEKQLEISILYIVEDCREQRRIPRLPMDTVTYPDCDAIIVCELTNPYIAIEKLKERTKLPIYYAGEFLDIRPTLF